MKMNNAGNMPKKAFVLLSGGIDSTTCLALAMEDYDRNVEAVTVDYGQRHIKEAEHAQLICDYYSISHTVLPLRGLLSGVGVMLTDPNVTVPNIPYSEIKGVSPTYVPFRNGTMLSAITAHAQKYVNQQITRLLDDPEFGGSSVEATQAAKDLCGVYFGAHAEDAHNWAYPDCTPEFVGAMANAIYIGTYFSVRLHAPFVSASKADIISTGNRFGVPYHLTWSCYKGEELQCGICPTCLARKEAFLDAGIVDPTIYKGDLDDDDTDTRGFAF